MVAKERFVDAKEKVVEEVADLGSMLVILRSHHLITIVVAFTISIENALSPCACHRHYCRPIFGRIDRRARLALLGRA